MPLIQEKSMQGAFTKDVTAPKNVEPARVRYLRIALLAVGVIFIAGIYPLTIVWPSGWSWHTGHSDYLQMILGLYATLGVFLLLASRKPLANLSLIWFTVWSSVAHAGIMAAQSVTNPELWDTFGAMCWRCLLWPEFSLC